MKSFKVKFVLKTGGTIETVIQANYSSDVKRIMEAQYGSSLRSIFQIAEIK